MVLSWTTRHAFLTVIATWGENLLEILEIPYAVGAKAAGVLCPVDPVATVRPQRDVIFFPV